MDTMDTKNFVEWLYGKISAYSRDRFGLRYGASMTEVGDTGWILSQRHSEDSVQHSVRLPGYIGEALASKWSSDIGKQVVPSTLLLMLREVAIYDPEWGTPEQRVLLGEFLGLYYAYSGVRRRNKSRVQFITAYHVMEEAADFLGMSINENCNPAAMADALEKTMEVVDDNSPKG